MSSNFSDNIINLYTIVYDCDAERIYTFTDFDKAVSSIESSIRGYALEENQEIDECVEGLRSHLHTLRDQSIIPISINDLFIVMYKWEIDQYNQIHKLLSKFYDVADDATKDEIEFLFN